jgi:hypothetical protein
MQARAPRPALGKIGPDRIEAVLRRPPAGTYRRPASRAACAASSTLLLEVGLTDQYDGVRNFKSGRY